jgi:hypothetical protein
VKNHLKTIFSLLLTAIFFAGCAQAPSVTTYRDPISSQETDLLSENELVKPGAVREVIWLNAARIPIKGEHKIYLEIQYAANKEAGYLEVYPGRTLTIVADGQELKFAGLGSLDKREKNNVVYETARYEAKLADIATIANAKKVTVLVQGKDLLIERDFAPDNFARFRQFYEKIRLPGRARVAPTVRYF